MKILNLYPGLGGNRKYWGEEHEVTAVEIDEATAAAYQHHFPNDIVIVGDAHQYLKEHYKEFDFIWSSPPCPTHSRLQTTRVGLGDAAVYPDMNLYQEIIFLKKWFKGDWVVENVIPYYKPLIEGKVIERHVFWSNMDIPAYKIKNRLSKPMKLASIGDYERLYGFDLKGFKLKDKRRNLRNCVHPELGQHILKQAI